MGTNYYYEPVGETEPCGECGHPKPVQLHIGKNSAGWVFSLHTIPDRGLYSLADWEAFWRNKPGRVVDEYGDVISMEDLLDLITNNKGNKRVTNHPSHRYGGPTYDLVDGSFS